MEISREWNLDCYIAQVDIKSAFDRVKHSAVLNAIKTCGGSKQTLALLASLLQGTKTQFRLGNLITDCINLGRGVPQGSPESQTLFTISLSGTLRTLVTDWTRRGIGWVGATPHEIQTERVSQSDVGYADDLLLFANNLTDLETMIDELMSALLPTGLEVGPEKTQWIRRTSRNRRGNDEVLRVGSTSITKSQNLVFLGCLLQPDNNDLMSIDHRRKKGEQAWHAWKKS